MRVVLTAASLLMLAPCWAQVSPQNVEMVICWACADVLPDYKRVFNAARNVAFVGPSQTKARLSKASQPGIGSAVGGAVSMRVCGANSHTATRSNCTTVNVTPVFNTTRINVGGVPVNFRTSIRDYRIDTNFPGGIVEGEPMTPGQIRRQISAHGGWSVSPRDLPYPRGANPKGPCTEDDCDEVWAMGQFSGASRNGRAVGTIGTRHTPPPSGGGFATPVLPGDDNDCRVCR